MFQIPLNCTGCHACANICPAKCIIMKKSETGFFYSGDRSGFMY